MPSLVSAKSKIINLMSAVMANEIRSFMSNVGNSYKISCAIFTPVEGKNRYLHSLTFLKVTPF